MLARHPNNEPQEIELAGSGSGGVNELIANLDDSTVMYGLCTFTQARAGPPAARFHSADPPGRRRRAEPGPPQCA